MKCQYCQNEIADSVKHCNFCGMEQKKEGSSHSAQPPQAASQHSNTKKKSPLISIVVAFFVFVAAGFIAKAFLVPSFLDKSASSVTNDTSVTESSSAYVFDLPTEPLLLLSKTYSMTDEIGGVYQLSFSYNEDIIYSMTQSYTLSIAGFDETTLAYLDEIASESEATSQNYDFISYSITKDNDTLTEIFSAENLNKKENITALSTSGLMDITSGDVDSLSMQKTDSELLSSGWTSLSPS